jgi:2-oxoisovalerate dehydrogenase E1 component
MTLPGEPRTASELLDATELRRLLVTMQMARQWDLRFENLLRTGAVSKWYSAVGNEALTVTAASLLDRRDTLVTLHRDVGAILRFFVDVESLFPDLFETVTGGDSGERSRRFLYRLACQMMGRRDGFTDGVERSYHYNYVDADTGRVHIGMISHLGSMIPVAAGCALASNLHESGGVALNFIGEGGTSTGDFHEGLNMAAVWKLPLVLVIENNGYAFSTPAREQYACESLAERASAYGIPGVRVDGNNPRAVHKAMVEAVERARRGEGPTLVEGVLGRLRGHSEQDRSLDGVPARELERYRREDPVSVFSEILQRDGVIDASFVASAQNIVRDLLIEVTDEAQGAPKAPADDVLPGRSVFCPVAEVPELTTVCEDSETQGGTESSYVECIRRALREEMAADDSVLLLGQDIAEFGGAFRVTEGFLEAFGPARIRNTPIAESGTIGIAIGAAMLGFRCVVEMQFADFVSCGFNQLVNVAAKMFFRSRMTVPIVVRCPSGGGAGAGPFHSQNPEAWFAHVAGLKVVAPAFPRDALGLLRSAIRDPNPVLFFEHKRLYRHVREPVPSGDVVVPLGCARTVRSGRDLTIVSYGSVVHEALEAASTLALEGVEAEVIDLRTIVPLDEETLLESARRTSRVLIAHEAPLTGGFGGEIAARIADGAFEYLDAPIKRLAFPDIPVPYEKSLEAACLPDADKIVGMARELVAY